MRPRCAACHADLANHLPLFDNLAFGNEQLGTMQKRAVHAVAMIDHQQVALKRESIFCRQRYNAVSGRNEERAGDARNIHATMRRAGYALIDALRPEQPRYPAAQRPDKILSPACAV